jgi:hypothetical protein
MRKVCEASSKQVFKTLTDFHQTVWLEFFITTTVRTSNPKLFLVFPPTPFEDHVNNRHLCAPDVLQFKIGIRDS